MVSNTTTGFSSIKYEFSSLNVGSENKNGAERKLRARQNVVFEHGFLIGKIGREHVCALVKDDIETPGDISGVVYLKYSDKNWMFQVAKELKYLDYNVDMNKI